MNIKLLAAANVLTLSAVYAQGAIFQNDSEDYQRTIHVKYEWLDTEHTDKDMIGFCAMGDKEHKFMIDFDGEFEGLSPRPGIREI